MLPTPDDLLALSAYIDNQLSPAERAALEQRLRQDNRLKAELDSLQTTVALVRSLPALKAPRNFTLDPAQFGQAKPTARVINLNARWVSRITAVASVAAVLLVVSALALNSMSENSQNEAISSKAMVENGADGTTPLDADITAVAQAALPTGTPAQTATTSIQPTPPPAATMAIAGASPMSEVTATAELEIQLYTSPEVFNDNIGGSDGMYPPVEAMPPASEGGEGGGGFGAGGAEDEGGIMQDQGGEDDGMSPPEGYTEVSPSVLPPLPVMTFMPPSAAGASSRSADAATGEVAENALDETAVSSAADGAMSSATVNETDRDVDTFDNLTPVIEWWNIFIKRLKQVFRYDGWY